MDLVYCWVDNTTPEYQKERKEQQIPHDPRLSSNEIYYSIMLAIKHCKFLRNIFIVKRPEQIPPKYEKYKDRVILINQYDLLPSNIKIPNFNSTVFETYLHNIPNLSPNFIYMNDDMFICRKLSLKKLRHKNGKFYSCIKYGNFNYQTNLKTLKERTNFHQCHQLNANIMFNRKYKKRIFTCWKTIHLPIILSKKAYEIAHKRFPEAIARHSQYKRRNIQNIHFTLLVQMIAIEEGIHMKQNLHEVNWRYLCLWSYNDRSMNWVLRYRPRFLCINGIWKHGKRFNQKMKQLLND